MRTPKAAKAMGAVLDFCEKKEIKAVQEEIESGIRTHDNLPMQSSLGIPNVAEYLSGKGYVFVVNDTNKKFLLSDNPACLFSRLLNWLLKNRYGIECWYKSPLAVICCTCR